MAGPSCSILLKEPLNEIQLAQLEEYVKEIGEMNETEYDAYIFWVKTNKLILRGPDEKGCNFSIYIWGGLAAEHGAEYEIEEETLKQLEQKIGFCPHGHIQLDAGCNQRIDHLLLGKMTLDLLNLFGGYIDFSGIVLERKYEDIFKGNLIEIWYESVNGLKYYHISDKDFFEDFIKSDHFRLIK